jgi:hypothetical protein
VLAPNRLIGLQRYLQNLEVGWQKRSLVPAPGRIFAELQKPMVYLDACSRRKDSASDPSPCHVKCEVIVSMETAVCFSLGMGVAWSGLG